MQVGGWASDGREGGTAEHTHSDGARQVTGLPAVAVPEVEGVQGLEVVRVGFQVHLAQELIFKDSVVPDLERDRGWCRVIAEERSMGLWGCGNSVRALSLLPGAQDGPRKRSPAPPLPHQGPWARLCPFQSLWLPPIRQSSLPCLSLSLLALLLTLGDLGQMIHPLLWFPHLYYEGWISGPYGSFQPQHLWVCDHIQWDPVQ